MCNQTDGLEGGNPPAFDCCPITGFIKLNLSVIGLCFLLDEWIQSQILRPRHIPRFAETDWRLNWSKNNWSSWLIWLALRWFLVCERFFSDLLRSESSSRKPDQVVSVASDRYETNTAVRAVWPQPPPDQSPITIQSIDPGRLSFSCLRLFVLAGVWAPSADGGSGLPKKHGW